MHFLALTSAALAGPTDDELMAARAAIQAGDFTEAERAVERAYRAAPDEAAVLRPAAVVRIFFYEGTARALTAGNYDLAMDSWRQALATDLVATWETGVADDDDGFGLWEALRAEMRDRQRVAIQGSGSLGAAQLYVDGEEHGTEDLFPPGEHLVQLTCPDGSVHGVWSDLARPIKWARLCPDSDLEVAAAAVASVQGDEWDEFGPSFGGAAAASGATPPPVATSTQPASSPSVASVSTSTARVSKPPPEPAVVASQPSSTAPGASFTTATRPAPAAAASRPATNSYEAAWPGDGPTSATAVTLAGRLTRAKEAYLRMDLPAFEKAMREAEEIVDRMVEPISPQQAATFHRTVALRAYLDSDRYAALNAFRAALNIEPDAELDSSLAPLGSPLYQVYLDAKRMPQGAEVPIEAAEDASFRVDGTASATRPREYPYILQVLDEDGRVLWSGHLGGGRAPPNWESVGVGAQPRASLAGLDLKLPPPALLGAGGAAVVSGGLYALATMHRSAYDDPAVQDLGELEELRRKTNSEAVLSAGAAAVAVGLGTWALWPGAGQTSR